MFRVKENDSVGGVNSPGKKMYERVKRSLPFFTSLQRHKRKDRKYTRQLLRYPMSATKEG